MSDSQVGPGYWQASDGLWYPPELHPNFQASSPPPPSPVPQPPGPGSQLVDGGEPSEKKPFLRRKSVWIVGAVAVLAGAAAIGGGSDDTEAVDVEPSAAVSTSVEPDVDTDPSPVEPEPEESDADIEEQPVEEPERDLGTREEPWNYGNEAPVVFDAFGDADRSEWNVTIGELADITETVLAENPFNEPPPEGVIFAGFSVEMTLVDAGKEPLSAGFNFEFEVLGAATSAVYGAGTIETALFGCGVTPDEFDDFAEVFIGGTLTGTVCIPIPIEDLADPGTRVAMNFGGNRIHFGPDGAVGQPFSVPAAAVDSSADDEPGSRGLPWPYGEETEIVFDAFGDADRSEWNVTIGELADITETVLAENPFNEPPPEGVIFAGFSVEMTLVDAGKEPLSAGFNFEFEVLGAATSAVYGAGTIETALFGCGVTPDEFDDFAEVFIGGTLTGTVCIPIPIEDLADPGTRVAMNFGGNRIHFG